MFEWIIHNKEWLFSGIGIAFLSVVFKICIERYRNKHSKLFKNNYYYRNLFINTYSNQIAELNEKKRLFVQDLNSAAKNYIEESLINDVMMKHGYELHQLNNLNGLLEIQPQKITITPEEKIIDIFNKSDKSLIILGDPGSGKTLKVIELANILCNQTLKDIKLPLPIYLNLSTWSFVESKKSNDKKLHQEFFDWLIKELSEKYRISGISKTIKRHLVNQKHIILLLDGLDEVEKNSQISCITAINDFIEEYGVSGVVVCCRATEYEKTYKKLKIRTSLFLHPLNEKQINNYLFKVCKTDLHKLLHEDKKLKNLITNPYMLNIFLLTYKDSTLNELLYNENDSIENIRKKLFDKYIQQRFDHHESSHNYPLYNRVNAIKYLAFLARIKDNKYSTIFSKGVIKTYYDYKLYHKLDRIFTIGLYSIFHLANLIILITTFFGLTALGELSDLSSTSTVSQISFITITFFIPMTLYLFNLLIFESKPMNTTLKYIEHIEYISFSSYFRFVANSIILILIIILFTILYFYFFSFLISLIYSNWKKFVQYIFYLYTTFIIIFSIFIGSLFLLYLLFTRCINYYFSYIVFFCKGFLPLKLHSFLDYSVKLKFLRKIGNDYLFMHQLLLYHFSNKFEENAKSLRLISYNCFIVSVIFLLISITILSYKTDIFNTITNKVIDPNSYLHLIINSSSKLIEIFPQIENSNIIFKEIYFIRACAYHDNKKFNKAMSDFQKASEFILDQVDTYLFKGYIFLIKKEYFNAIQYFTKAINIKPNNAEAYYGRGVSLTNLKNYEKAIIDFDKTIEYNGKKAIKYFKYSCFFAHLKNEVYFYRGIANYNLNDYQKAVLDFNKSVEKYPMMTK